MTELRAGGATKMLYLRQSVDERLLTAAWCRATGESVTILPALDGHGVDLVPRRTSKLTKAECCELIEYITAWAVEHGVEHGVDLDEFWPEELAHE